ncbi:MAG TPA: hypothetical protein DCE25_07440, partial [Pseudomonas sp.]|nr:hypothetical protein [Pseudomonas sp.]
MPRSQLRKIRRNLPGQCWSICRQQMPTSCSRCRVRPASRRRRRTSALCRRGMSLSPLAMPMLCSSRCLAML